MQPNQIQIQGAQPTGARIQLQTQPIPQPQHRLVSCYMDRRDTNQCNLEINLKLSEK